MQTTMSANRMFMLHATVAPKTTNCFQTTIEDNTHIWHYKYGHLSYKGLRILQHKQMVRGLPQLKDSSKICTDCMWANNTGRQFQRKVYEEHLKGCN